jgi:hypothetical protein
MRSTVRVGDSNTEGKPLYIQDNLLFLMQAHSANNRGFEVRVLSAEQGNINSLTNEEAATRDGGLRFFLNRNIQTYSHS